MSDYAGQKLLIFSAHATDFISKCAGTVARYTAGGGHVRVVDLTFGERGECAELWNRNPGITVEMVKDIRKAEAAQAAEILGAEIRFLDFDDTPLIMDRDRLLRMVDELHEFRPDIVLTHHLEDRLNYDHAATTGTYIRALKAAQQPGVRPGVKVLGAVKSFMFEPDQSEFSNFRPDTYIDITGVMDLRTQAMEAIASQSYMIELCTNRAWYRGYQARRVSDDKSIQYAEAYMRFEPYVGRSFA